MSIYPFPCIVLILLSFFLIPLSVGKLLPITREEAQIAGVTFRDPFVIAELIISPIFKQIVVFKEKKEQEAIELEADEYIGQYDGIVTSQQIHEWSREFCSSRQRGCSNEQYYAVVDKLIDFLSETYPHQKRSPINSYYVRYDFDYKYHNPRSLCKIARLDTPPTPAEFYDYVKKSKPFIVRAERVRNIEQKNWKSKEEVFNDWSLEKMESLFGNSSIVINASPTSDFDGPELLSDWNISLDPLAKDFGTNNISLIVRPAQIRMSFSQFAGLMRRKHMNTTNFYLEYFPVPVLLNSAEESLRKRSSSSVSRKDLNNFKRFIPDNKWSSFLSRRYHLMWLGIGHNDCINSSTKGAECSFTNILKPTTSRLHFDRFENIMNVLQGSKTFHLFPPTESENLYGGDPVISASFTANEVFETRHKREDTLSRQTPSGFSSVGQDETLPNYEFVRDVNNVNYSPNKYHTYSPVDISVPNFSMYPRLATALESMQVCQIRDGESIFVPSHWWHEVTSLSSPSRPTLATNMFFEPYYLRRDYDTKSDEFYVNDYYSSADIEKMIRDVM